MAAFLSLMEERRVEVHDLVTHRFTIDDGPQALELLTKPRAQALAVVIEYPIAAKEVASPQVQRRRRSASSEPTVGFIGAGSFACRHLIPLAREHGLILDRVATASGLSAVSAAEQFGFRRGACTVEEVLEDSSLSAVFVATRHDQHAQLSMAALQAGKAVFVEKPLCLSEDELTSLRQELVREDVPPLMVGFNRRFAPLTVTLRKHLASAHGPTNALIRVNAATLPSDHWLNHPSEGGGRLLGEGCHFIDLIAHLVAADPVAVYAQGRAPTDQPIQSVQDFTVSIRFLDGSLGTLLYGTAGSPVAGKELVEVHRGEISARINDFRNLKLWRGGRSRTFRSRGQDKGHSEEVRLFSRLVRKEATAVLTETYVDSTALTLAALRSLQSGVEEQLSASP
jgi:predicted dehydrogenase